MAEITAAAVKALREQTGAGMMDCKKALSETQGDTEKAIELLRKWGLKDVSKRAGKIAAEGVVLSYIHPGDRVGVLLELNCETDFVARGEEFREIAHGIAMHIAAMNPPYVSKEDVPAQEIEKEKEILLATLNDKQKQMADKIIPGKLNKFYEDNVLLDQIYIKDEEGQQTIQALIDDLSAKVGEKVRVRRFQRFEVGEGMEKKSENLAEEVAKTIGEV
ncbi:MAG: translation elongation factor Ts [Bdellovibrionota bacterium]|jgi:elongation factor Ts